jgi:hypothetical protein
MLRLARRRLGNELPDRAGQVRFLHRDITSWTPLKGHYDLVVTHFILDCFPEPELTGIIKKLASAAKSEAAWVTADFRLPARGLARFRARVWLAAMYEFFRFTARISAAELVDPTSQMQAAGFTLAHQHLFQQGMLKSELWRRDS